MRPRSFVSLIATSDTDFLSVRTVTDMGTYLTLAHPYVFERLRVELKPTGLNLQFANLPPGFIITHGQITLRWGDKTIIENVICNPNMNMDHKLVIGKRVVDELNIYQ